MIKANELRIGNWVRDTWQDDQINNIIELNALEFSVRVCKGNCNKLEPIPLTPEVLKACGCTQGEDKEMWRNSQGVWLTQRHNTDMFFVIGFRFGHYIKYLHEYQNVVYAFTGEELEINMHEKV